MMLTLGVHGQLATLTERVYQLIESVNSDAAPSEVELRAEATRTALAEVQATIGAGPTGHFNSLARHVHWLVRYYLEGKPDRYAADIEDLLARDLPGVIEAIKAWVQALLYPGLVAAVQESWGACQYDNSVRDAFIYLEDVLRDLGQIDRARGLSGERLVTAVLGPNGEARVTLPADRFLGQLTRGEATGAYHLVRGAFLLLRNATAHRPIPYTAAEAGDVIHLVNLCLRVLPDTSARPRPE
jgi:hypothetical protein